MDKRTRMNVYSIAHHLAVCGAHYEDNARAIRKAIADGTEPAAYEGVAKQFDRQAQECREWSGAIHAHDGIEVDGDAIETIMNNAVTAED
jgi:hypothetical protein